MYNLPLLPGYGASTKIRSSPAIKSPGGVSLLERMTIAEDLGYNDSYFPPTNDDPDPSDYILSHSPPSPMSPVNLMSSMDVPAGHGEEREQVIEEVQERLESGDGLADTPALRAEGEVGVKAAVGSVGPIGTHMSPSHPGYLEHVPSTALDPSDLRQSKPHKPNGILPRYPSQTRPKPKDRRKSALFSNQIAEAVFFSYGVSVFFGFHESEERMIMEDCESAGVWARGQEEDDWEVEEFHYTVRSPHRLLGVRLMQRSMTRTQSTLGYITTCSVRLL